MPTQGHPNGCPFSLFRCVYKMLGHPGRVALCLFGFVFEFTVESMYGFFVIFGCVKQNELPSVLLDIMCSGAVLRVILGAIYRCQHNGKFVCLYSLAIPA